MKISTISLLQGCPTLSLEYEHGKIETSRVILIIKYSYLTQ